MAQYFTDDFADWSTDWTARYNTGTPDWAAALSGGDVLIPNSGTSDWSANTWNDVEDSNHAEIDILALINASSLSTAQRIFVLRASGADESATHVHFSIFSSNHSIGYCAGSDTRTNIATHSATYNTSTDYWVRVRISGTGTPTYKTKVWSGAAGDEPGGVGSDTDWNLNSTNTNIPDDAGWVGISFTGAGANTTVKQFGVGTNGDTAPSSAGGGTTVVESDLAATYAVNGSVSSDLSAAYDVLAAVQSDLAATYAVNSAVTSDLSASYAVVSAVTSDLSASYTVEGATSAVESDLAASYAVLGAVQSDLAATFGVLAAVTSDLAATYDVLAAVTSDLEATYTIEEAGSVTSDLSCTYAVLSAVQSDLVASYTVEEATSAVTSDLVGAYDVLAEVHADLAAAWQVVASITSDLACTYIVGDYSPLTSTPERTYLIPPELRTLTLRPESRVYEVPPESRTWKARPS